VKKKQMDNSSVAKRGGQPKTIDEIKTEAKVRPDEAYFSTGEISRLLGGIISRSTVTRMFDKGNFEGRVNPLSGKREIKWHAVIKWLERKGFAVDKIAVIEKRYGEEWTRLKRKEETESGQTPKHTG
jgi:hypothetical protein